MTEGEMVGWHHRLSGHEFEQTLGHGEGQGSLACCSQPMGSQRVGSSHQVAKVLDLQLQLGLPFPSPVDHVFSELSTMTCPSWVALHGMAPSFLELHKTVIHVIILISFL